MLLTFDIETLPCSDTATIGELAKTIAVPGNIKLPESIAKWHTENGAQALADMVAKTSFDGLFGKIACIGWAFGDGDVQCTSHKSTEAEIIAEFYSAVESELEVSYHGGHTSTPLQVCGHNIAGFDLPFLKARSIILGIKPPPGLWRAMKAKPWDECIMDTMLMWNSDSQKRVKMDKLCKAFGIQGKDGFDGSMVAETWPVDPQKVCDYCCDDVERTRKIYKRLTFTGVAA